jgi:hypothetical protein
MYTLPPRLVLDVSIVDAMLSVQFAEIMLCDFTAWLPGAYAVRERDFTKVSASCAIERTFERTDSRFHSFP